MAYEQSLYTESDQRYWMLYERGIIIALLVHLFFIFLFYLIDVIILSVINIGSVIIYALCIHLINNGFRNTVIILTWLEVIAHAFLAVLFLGWDSGFHYYLLVIIPLIFTSSTRKLWIVGGMTFIVCLSYMAMDAYMRGTIPSYEINPAVIDAMRYINIFITFGFLGYIAFVYVHTVNVAEKQLYKLAKTDSLTGLYNRRCAIEMAEYEIKQFRRDKRPFSISIADIDNFKNVNDHFGHEAGDEVLRNVSDVLTRSLRDKDIVARWGGEEFLILLSDTDLQEARYTMNRLRESIHHAFSARQAPANVTLTFGIAQFREDDTLDQCISRADEALLKGKSEGKDRLVLSALAG